MKTCWTITFSAPFAMRSPFPLITPALPIPRMDLFDPTLIGVTPAASYVTLIVVDPAPALPLLHLQKSAWFFLTKCCVHLPAGFVDSVLSSISRTLVAGRSAAILGDRSFASDEIIP
jgi:hypothetical protein